MENTKANQSELTPQRKGNCVSGRAALLTCAGISWSSRTVRRTDGDPKSPWWEVQNGVQQNTAAAAMLRAGKPRQPVRTDQLANCFHINRNLSVFSGTSQSNSQHEWRACPNNRGALADGNAPWQTTSGTQQSTGEPAWLMHALVNPERILSMKLFWYFLGKITRSHHSMLWFTLVSMATGTGCTAVHSRPRLPLWHDTIHYARLSRKTKPPRRERFSLNWVCVRSS